MCARVLVQANENENSLVRFPVLKICKKNIANKLRMF